MPLHLSTTQLMLRPFRKEDAQTIFDCLQDKDIAAMIPAMPWPYSLDDAHAYITRIQADERMTFAIDHEGTLIGTAGLGPQLGYWLRRDAWGQGFATEAARALCVAGFDAGAAELRSGHRLGNDRSRHVLRKIGFEDTGQRSVFCVAEGRAVTMQDMRLTRNAWAAL